ncbi:sodium/proton-translocating pyrophosphatase, partial [Akkermansiaceae bacterium]|nr:sodium/proton-translocating pyrophosphatase [Akkermansiaceae bacterium]
MSSSIPNIDPLPKRPSPYWVRLRSYGIVIAVLWLIELLDSLLLGSRFEMWGIQPRDFSELEGIIFAPFLHAGWGHLLSNSIALLILGAALLMSGWRDLLIVSVVSALVAGVIVWVIGESNSVHIGASSVVFGYFVGLMIGGAIPFLNGAITMNAVGEAAFDMITEIRRQFREIPGLLEGTAEPETDKCIDIATAAATRRMIGPALLAVGTPLIVGFGFEMIGAEGAQSGAKALAGTLIGALLGCVLLALMMSNAGG